MLNTELSIRQLYLHDTFLLVTEIVSVVINVSFSLHFSTSLQISLFLH